MSNSACYRRPKSISGYGWVSFRGVRSSVRALDRYGVLHMYLRCQYYRDTSGVANGPAMMRGPAGELYLAKVPL